MIFDIPLQLLPASARNQSHPIQQFSALDFMAEIESESYQLFASSVEQVKIIARKYITVVACSFGKDSTATLLVALKAHLELIEEGAIPKDKPFVICSIDTGVENHLVKILVRKGCDELKAFARKHEINIDIRIGQPPLSKTWASLFLSGLKLISASRLNSDCSVILKVENAAAIERQILTDYGCENVITLLGVRHAESKARSASIKRHNNDVSAADLIEYDNGDMVFAPIVDWSDDNVWTVLRCAGKKPITSSKLGNAPLFSYAANHRFLHIVYSNSKDGSCPTSSKRITGEKAVKGGCGGSARTGCYLCAKSIVDKSGEAQASLIRHSVISGNVLKIRNYIMTVAQNITHRTWLAKAIDATTGAIALQPNMLDAETIDKLLWLLCQATHDDLIRAEKFRDLVATGRDLEDAGYADIMNDSTMTDLERYEMASAYKQYAVEPLVSPMSLEQALYISAIHSRDGVKLPPYRAFYIWNATQNGERIPYPDFDPTLAVVDDIPDPIMVIPLVEMPSQPSFSLDGVFDLEAATGCDADSKLQTELVPVKIARYFLPDAELNKLNGLKDSDKVEIAGLNKIEITRKQHKEVKTVAPVLRFSKRRIKRVSRKSGSFVVLERGRTSQDKPSFGERSSVPNFVNKVSSPVFAYLPTTERIRGPLIEIDDNQNGYDINFESMLNWFDFDGAERALEAHDAFINSRAKCNEHIYYFGGTGVIESLLRYGVLRINSSSKRNLCRIIQRTGYFASLGLLSVDDSSIKRLATERNCSRSIVNQYRAITATIENDIAKVIDMKEFRSFKAKALLSLRRERNMARKFAKARYKLFTEDSVMFSVNQYAQTFNLLLPYYVEAVENIAVFGALVSNKISFFDGIDIYNQFHTFKGVRAYIRAMATDFEMANSLFDKSVQCELKSNPQSRLLVNNAMVDNLKLLNDIELGAQERLLMQVRNNAGGYKLWYLVQSSGNVRHTILNNLTNITPVVNQQSKFKKNFKLSDTIVQASNIIW